MTSVFTRPPVFDPSAALTAPTVYLTRIAESPIHHNRVSGVAFIPNAGHADRHVVLQSAVLADYDCMAVFLRMAGYRLAGGAHANSSKRAGGNACVQTLTEVWTKE